MDQLRELRDQIDQIDRQMVALFEQRMSVVCRVAEFKREQGMPILQRNREKIVLEKAKSLLKNKDYEQVLESFMTHLMSLSRIQQARAQTLDEKQTGRIPRRQKRWQTVWVCHLF